MALFNDAVTPNYKYTHLAMNPRRSRYRQVAQSIDPCRSRESADLRLPCPSRERCARRRSSVPPPPAGLKPVRAPALEPRRQRASCCKNNIISRPATKNNRRPPIRSVWLRATSAGGFYSNAALHGQFVTPLPHNTAFLSHFSWHDQTTRTRCGRTANELFLAWVYCSAHVCTFCLNE